jgi:hypothetical protein
MIAKSKSFFAGPSFRLIAIEPPDWPDWIDSNTQQLYTVSCQGAAYGFVVVDTDGNIGATDPGKYAHSPGSRKGLSSLRQAGIYVLQRAGLLPWEQVSEVAS